MNKIVPVNKSYCDCCMEEEKIIKRCPNEKCKYVMCVDCIEDLKRKTSSNKCPNCRGELFNMNIVTAYISHNPFSVKETIFSDYYSIKNYSYLINLNNDEEQIFKNFKLSLRKKIKKSLDSQIKIIGKNLITYKIFINLYKKTLKRLGILSKKIGTEESFLKLFDENDSIKINGIVINNQIVSISIFFLSPNHADYFLNVSDDNYNYFSALLIYDMIIKLKNYNIKLLNIGGGMTNNDSLEQFKRSFRGLQKEFLYSKLIIDKDFYNKEYPKYLDKSYFPVFFNNND